MSPVDILRGEEEEWRPVFTRLCGRFASFPPERVLDVLREHDGHAGQTAAVLRDLSRTEMRPVDPDDAEHVKTLLSSPMIFQHACKEHFRRFDTNRNGVLEWKEIVLLVNSLYDNFGLPLPREGALHAFFNATDMNHDGVLSEQEFRTFFECFLRYAFFDVVSNESKPKPPKEPRSPVRKIGAPVEVADCTTGPLPVLTKQQKEPGKSPTQKQVEGKQLQSLNAQSVGGQGDDLNSKKARRQEGLAMMFRCYAPKGVECRTSPGGPVSEHISKGEVVRALEHWIRTPQGWCMVLEDGGEPQFLPSTAQIATKEKQKERAPPARLSESPPPHRSSSPKQRRPQQQQQQPQQNDAPKKVAQLQQQQSKGNRAQPPPLAEDEKQAAVDTPTTAASGNARRQPSMVSQSSIAEVEEGEKVGNPNSEVPKAESELPASAAAREETDKEKGKDSSSKGGNGNSSSKSKSKSKKEQAAQVDENVGLRPEESEWQQLFDRLQGRFPQAKPCHIAEALRECDGHAGQAATRLR
eukprot:CAMPEP_0206614040 /NCGR_PEP_ID=MMETSP0325_2-20121206/57107_1 /ASSEMBLY_ACC=CAM_ASM_000347 /TAXON_ID=2866 /ORGANISM="Crypthecodinium cohnii, Strain Seligo" /LENGTH=523 /DNA_ID=CAMNT_0054134365 /DNA_START=105 /DNA_END=1672 /DNA_ORIENTATION=+